MEISTFARDLTIFLAPFLPTLLKAGGKAVDTAAGKIGEDSWVKIKSMWSKLGPKLKAKPAALEAVQDVAAAPEKEQAQNALAWQMEKLLGQDQPLLEELVVLLEQAKNSAKGAVIAGAKGSLAVGRDITDSVVITGNQNVTAIGDADGPDKRQKGKT
jgi:hypothetical protein